MENSWFSLSDGRTVFEKRGPDRSLASIDAYWGLLTSQGAQALRDVPRLRVLGLSGQHFPTFKVDADRIQQLINFGGVEELRLNGSSLSSEIVSSLFLALSDLDSADARGIALDSTGLEALIKQSPQLRQLQVGLTASRSLHRFPFSVLSASSLNKLTDLKALDSLAVRGLPLTIDELVDVLSPHNLVRLDCGETNLTTDTLRQLSLRNLRYLDADLCRLDEDCGSVLALEYPYLEHLNLSGNLIGDSSINALMSLQGIRSLKLAATGASDASVDAILRLELLESLDVSSNDISNTAVQRIVENSLRLRELSVSNVEPDSIEGFRNIDRLYISGSGSEAFYEALQAVSGIVELTASLPPRQRQSLPPRLKNFAVISPIDADALRPIFQSSSIERLSIETEGEAYALLTDSDLPMLRELFAEAQGLTDDSLQRLAARPRLEALFISDNPLSDMGVASLAESRFLHTLELRNTLISGQAIDTLVGLPSLHCLDVPGTGISADAVAKLGNAKVLQSLALDPTQITRASVLGLAQLETLVELYVYGSASIQQLGMLQELPSLHELVLFGATFDDPALASAIASIEKLRHLRGAVGVNLATALRAVRPDLMINRARAVTASVEPFREGRFLN
jgi:hypothetical protein